MDPASPVKTIKVEEASEESENHDENTKVEIPDLNKTVEVKKELSLTFQKSEE